MADTQTWFNFASVEDVRGIPDVASTQSEAIQTQYAFSADFQNLGSLMQDVIDATPDLERLHAAAMDPQTAYGVYLDWWGQKVGVDRFIKVRGEYVRFDDDYFRFLILYRAACNISNGSADAANKLLQRLTDTTVFVVDYLDMSVNSIVIIGNISDLQAMILQTYGLLNRPAGVLTNLLVIYPDEQIFGFEGSTLMPFDVGVFNPGRTIEID
ncbi:MAG: DUF2612 domain-containing protein [Sutterella sp.]|jgi:hypothetical protein|nr:DUF2612 domain-containing protein [Sutterella sp.]